jgi:hypothetical protein
VELTLILDLIHVLEYLSFPLFPDRVREAEAARRPRESSLASILFAVDKIGSQKGAVAVCRPGPARLEADAVGTCSRIARRTRRRTRCEVEHRDPAYGGEISVGAKP